MIYTCMEHLVWIPITCCMEGGRFKVGIFLLRLRPVLTKNLLKASAISVLLLTVEFSILKDWGKFDLLFPFRRACLSTFPKLGDLGYADDLCLLSPNRGSMRIMLKIGEGSTSDGMFERGKPTYSEGSNSSWSPS